MTGVPLCRLADIADGESNGFIVTRAGGAGRPNEKPGAGIAAGSSVFGACAPGGERLSVLAVRRGTKVFAYVNSCPHTQAPLDFLPGVFLTLDKTLIQCSTHGALFRIEDGFCVQGPCAGKSLVPVAVAIEGETVHLAG